jgi:RND superfamily putative drug exporter
VSAFLYRLGRLCYRSRGRVLAAWLAVVALVGILAVTTGGSYDDGFRVPGASSQRALDMLNVTFPEAADASASVVVGAPPGKVMTDPSVKKAVKTYLEHLDQLPFVKGSQTPYSDYLHGLISDGGSHALIRVRVEGTVSTFTDAQRDELREAAQEITTLLPGSTVNVGGDVYSVHIPELSLTEALGVVVAVIVLLVVLGSVVGAALPLASALTGVGLGAALVMVGAGIIEVNSTSLMLVVMLGLAVGIDYALFIISRHRDQLGTGMDAEESAARAVATAGSAVVFAGLTVVIALVGLSLAGLPFLSVMGVFTAVAVAIEVALALTLLPALLGFAGERLRPRPRTRVKSERATAWAGRGGASGWWVRVVTRWPVVTVLLVVAGMGAMAVPALELELALPTSGQSVPGSPDRITADLITAEFGPGFNGPLVVTGSVVESDDPLEIIDGLKAEIEAMPGVHMVAAAVPNENADTAMIQIIPATGPVDPATAELVEQLRSHHDEWAQRWGIDTAITGVTAVQIDITNRLRDALLPFGIFVVGLSLVLLAMAFRSLLVPLKAAIGYLFSVTAAFGVTTLVFSKGWFAALINLPEPGPVMGILFGLAMDYEVFLTSRMREEYVHGNTERWVEDGFIHSAKVVIAAALIMFSVFAFFVPSGIGVIKPIAFSLALGVALDAFLIRMTLGPAVMKLLGDRAWWLPEWLDRRMPVLDVEGEALAHQMALADWPVPGDTAAIHAEGLAAEVDHHVLFRGVDVRVEPGEVLVVTGEHVQRLALLYGLSGRAGLNGGEAKVLGHVLPEEASLVRSRTPVVLAAAPDADVLRAASGGIVLVDAADELPDAETALLVERLTAAADADRPTTWVLGTMPGTDVAALGVGAHRTLDLTPHLAVAAGGTR